ncbi:hypothetical protein GCM10011609_42570 [Lentzea pudingi]|uniref:Uncharacterized protein n=2 Tax=Lentzea pudingi TaxID=1789439 RepID=A0ABQ2I5Y8_9PSEU|nr:hypothetical protein GCM10011609_42570 [Lentzea pudingi]
MELSRPAKITIRQWWLASVRAHDKAALANGVPLYLTLPGQHGLDIKLLIDEGVIRTTEAGPIVAADASRIVAIESNMMACGLLRKKIPGLSVRQENISGMLSWNFPDVFPDSKNKKQFRAAVVNLDFNQSLKMHPDGTIPVLNAIDKIARIHEGDINRPPIDWTLCLTLNADLICTPQQRGEQAAFIADQVFDCPDLMLWVETHLRDQLDELEQKPEVLDSWDKAIVQRLLMVLVPLRIIQLACARGWRVNCQYVAGYGEHPQETPMVTFVINFEWNDTGRVTPAQTSKTCREQLPAAMCRVLGDGSVEHLPASGTLW